MSFRPAPICLLFAIGLCLTACSRPTLEPGWAHIDLDASNAETLLRFGIGGYVSAAGGDPFKAGWLTQESGEFRLNVDSLRSRVLDDSLFRHAASDNRIDADEWRSFVNRTYYRIRGLPPDLSALRESISYLDDKSAWFRLDLNGVMTRLRRRMYVSRDDIRVGLKQFEVRDRRILFDEGSVVVGEHLDGDELIETTVMVKRGDGFWDFAAYDADGRLTGKTETPPKQLDVPLQCVGCHYGNRLFEPEKSYPVDAGSRGGLERRIYFDPRPESDLVEFFDEHRRRSDGILGLYATLYTQELMVARDRGEASALDVELLTSLGL